MEYRLPNYPKVEFVKTIERIYLKPGQVITVYFCCKSEIKQAELRVTDNGISEIFYNDIKDIKSFGQWKQME